MRELSRVFANQGTILPAHISRLCVLYEDLRIEILAAAELSIPLLDITDEHYRRHYFLRRCIATLFEFAETLRLLNKCGEFHIVRSTFTPPLVKHWDDAVLFFGKHEALLELVRNDIGGHFGLKAAVYGLANVDATNPEEIGSERRKCTFTLCRRNRRRCNHAAPSGINHRTKIRKVYANRHRTSV
jgi:hypothetical protein